MIFNILYALPIFSTYEVEKRIKTIFIISFIIYASLYALIYSKISSDIPYIADMGKYFYMLVGIDVIAFGLLSKFYYKLDIVHLINVILCGDKTEKKTIVYANDAEITNDQPQLYKPDDIQSIDILPVQLRNKSLAEMHNRRNQDLDNVSIPVYESKEEFIPEYKSKTEPPLPNE